MKQKYLEFAKNIAIVAGQIMKKYFVEDNRAELKFDNTIVTKADKEINDYLIERVKLEFPTHCVDGEEKQFGKSDYVWVCDPVDGTAMYARHIPVAVFSLALVVKGEPLIGVVYDPWTDSMYHAMKNLGAYKNNIKISVNNIKFGDYESRSNFDMWPMAEYNIYDTIIYYVKI